MKIETLPIEDVKANPSNPRSIKADKYQKLLKSIKEFPEMLNASEAARNG
jgi:ParB-like chromosome segregation protein Spo0J